jgi:hypothetical protein
MFAEYARYYFEHDFACKSRSALCRMKGSATVRNDVAVISEFASLQDMTNTSPCKDVLSLFARRRLYLEYIERQNAILEHYLPKPTW